MGLEPVAEEEEEVVPFQPSADLTNLLEQSVDRTGSNSSIEPIPRLPSPLQSTLLTTVGVKADYSQRIDLQRLQLQFVSLNLNDRIDLQPVLRYSLH